ncbi:MAG: hypothetical protein AAGI45_13460 [Cyanobacteria bacterium P01_H01_bin.26]
MATKREELQVAMATLEIGFVDFIKSHTEHKTPTILEPYDTFEIDGSKLTLFAETEFDQLLRALSIQESPLLYNAPAQACQGLVSVRAFRELESEKYIGLDAENLQVWAILGASQEGITRIKDQGFWGFFEGNGGKKYLFSKGSEAFATYEVAL